MRIRTALVAIALLGFGGTMSAGHAEEGSPAPALAAAGIEAPTFTPTIGDEADFDDAFDHLPPADLDPAIPAHAVDLDTIEPVIEPEVESLGSGVASYYGARFAGRPTASGEAFDPQRYTAAHRSLPFGSRVRVTNKRNGKSVIVRINDRGPFVRGRTIDLSRRAAEDIGIVSAGHGSVDLALLD